MKKINVLDCTLRDGGYCNNWNFGKEAISKIVGGLTLANLDFIEIGFITNKIIYDANVTKFNNFNQVNSTFGPFKYGSPIVAMINYGEYSIEDIPEFDINSSIQGIRIAFHRKDLGDALAYCKLIKSKGYKVFIQPMVTMNYSDSEFLNMIDTVNEIEPFAFYIVDSFGTMKQRNLIHFMELAESNLNNNICLGFHSHNNLQLAYSNAQTFIEYHLNRNIIVDSSIHGMGRGAGNLNTELFLENLNELHNTNYLLKPIFNLIDEIIGNFYDKHPWGYSLPQYISAKHLIHPNYAIYLNNKKTLTFEAMDEIFESLDPAKKVEYDERYIEQVYINYLSNKQTINSSITDLCSDFHKRKVLLIATGLTSENQKDRIISFVNNEKPIVISINHDYTHVNSDYIFVSNIRRFKQIKPEVYHKTIVTSNIENQGVYMSIPYYKLLSSTNFVRDNAGLMAIKFLCNIGVTHVFLAGYDGYDHNSSMNFENSEIAINLSPLMIDKLNYGMAHCLEIYRKDINLTFLTDSKFVQLLN